MISISRDELEQYPVLGAGKYGKVYQISDSMAYKIYHRTLADYDGFEMINPVLLTSKKTIQTLLDKDSKLKYTDLIQDYIIVDGYFGGVCIPYYDGKTLAQLKNTPYQVKRDISKQMVRNHRELLRNNIYPKDYHTGNIMVTEDQEVKMIDLDDHLTRVTQLPNPFLALLTTGRLNETIRILFGEPIRSRGKELEEMLEKPRAQYSPSIHWLDSYLARLEACQDYLIIDSYSDLNIVFKFTNYRPYRILFQLDYNLSEFSRVVYALHSLKEKGVTVYDLVMDNQIDDYFTNNPAKRKILISASTSQVLKY